MEDSSASNAKYTDTKIPFGMSSFGENSRQQFGENIRLAMACIEGSATPASTKAMPSDEAAIHQRLQQLSQDITSSHADLLELLVRFDDMEGWKSRGASHCAAWVNLELGISLQLAWEYLRVGRKLRLLPTATALFRAGKISWSKIRLLVRVADTENEKTLCHAALDASVTDVQRLCSEFRWTEDEKSNTENDRALKQWESRTLMWDELSSGSTRIQLVLPPEIAQAFLNSVEHSLAQMDSDDVDQKLSQRRADAAVIMAETSLQSASRDIATADRYQVIVSVDAPELSATAGYGMSNEYGAWTEYGASAEQATSAKQGTCAEQATASNTKPPPKRASVKGASFLARETAKRIACDCTVSTITKDNGEPVDIGRRSRIWPNAMARAIKDRDQHCQFYGCTQTNNLQIHHIIHWADGGTTSVSNGACLCAYHHVMVHEGGYRIQAVANDDKSLNEQFGMQQRKDDISMFSFEKELRNDRNSFDRVRKLASTRYRFRIVNSDGQDIRMAHYPVIPSHSTHVECCEPLVHNDSTRVECGEPAAGYYYRSDRNYRYDNSCCYSH
ncbi:HNH endonuclease [Granulosicoccus sp.]|nr:HNH endonuclease signature motif containing protein [Granulosicoccus sp.]MDB4222772.1 HNH endonuclease [Granulosicoccus sp.]